MNAVNDHRFKSFNKYQRRYLWGHKRANKFNTERHKWSVYDVCI